MAPKVRSCKLLQRKAASMPRAALWTRFCKNRSNSSLLCALHASHLRRWHASPWKPASHIQRPLLASQWPRFEHTASEWASSSPTAMSDQAVPVGQSLLLQSAPAYPWKQSHVEVPRRQVPRLLQAFGHAEAIRAMTSIARAKRCIFSAGALRNETLALLWFHKQSQNSSAYDKKSAFFKNVVHWVTAQGCHWCSLLVRNPPNCPFLGSAVELFLRAPL